jgi:chaperone required for assembly of F1-ATPase
MKVVLLLSVAIALGGLHQGQADLNSEMVSLGLQRRQLQQKKASSAANIEMDWQVGMLKQLLRRG